MDSWYIFFFFALQPWVSSDYHQFGVLMCETVWNIWSFQTHVSLRLYDVTRGVFFSSLFSPQGHWAYIIENKNCFSLVSMDTIIDLSDEFDTCVVYLCTFPAYLSPFPACSLFTATSSTQLEDLSYLDNQRAAGHRSSVRKHNTAGRTNDDLKGILWLNLEVKSACKWSLVQKHLQTCVKHICTSSMSLLELHILSGG